MAFMFFIFFQQKAVILRNRRFQKIALFNQPFAERSAHHAACHQAKRRCRRTNRRCPGNSEVLQHGTKRTRRTVSARHRNRAGTHADQRIEVQKLRQAYRSSVLQHDQTDYQSQKDNHGFPAAFQNLQICLKAYRGKEKHHEYFF